MANTVISDIATRIQQLEGAPGAKRLYETVATDVYPGQYVLNIAGVYTLGISTTAAHKLLTGGVVGYNKRVRSDGTTQPTIDQIWDIDAEISLAKVPIEQGGIVAALCVDPAATVDVGAEFVIGTTAGSLIKRAAAADSAILATLARPLVSGDTVGFFDLECKKRAY